MFTGPVLEKDSIGFPVQSWEKVLCFPKSNTRKKFYRFSSPILGKGFWFLKPVLG